MSKHGQLQEFRTNHHHDRVVYINIYTLNFILYIYIYVVHRLFFDIYIYIHTFIQFYTYIYLFSYTVDMYIHM